MSILIKNMEMPTNCMGCPFKRFDRVDGRGNICGIDDSITLHAVLDGVDVKFVRMGDCPLVPLPLPSEQPEQHWIPCSERLPHGSCSDLVNVSIHDDSGDTPFDYTSCGWVTTDGEYWIVDNEINNHVIAWMPLPEPYTERRNDG